VAGFPVLPIGDDGTAGVPGALRLHVFVKEGVAVPGRTYATL
jgi:hypothetical protein